MQDRNRVLAINFTSNSIYFAVADTANSGNIKHVGKIDLNFSVVNTLNGLSTNLIQSVSNAITGLIQKYEPSVVKMLTFSDRECWTVLPKSVFDNAAEREAHLNILVQNKNRKDIEMFWFELSKPDFRFLAIRDREVMKLFEQTTGNFGQTEFCSDFEIGLQWVRHTKKTGSFLMIGCHESYLTLEAYILGKFRAAHILKFNRIEDLPFLWKQAETHLNWIKGYHEEIVLFGSQTRKFEDLLKSYWDSTAEISHMDTLESMQVKADELTYSFPLTEAFPSIMMSQIN